MCQHYFQTCHGKKCIKSLMSAFIDLEASVDHEEVLEASEEEITNFIQDAPDEDDTSDVDNAPTAGPSTVAPVLGIPEQEKMWTDLLERATLHATRGQMVPETNNKNSIHDVPPKFWALSDFAAFIMPLFEKQVWLEVEMSYTLKAWLKDIPGVHLWNQQPILHALSPLDGFRALLSTNSSKLLVIELDGSEKLKVLKKGGQQYLWHGLVYEYDLLVHCISFSQVEMAHEIPNSLMCKVHPNLVMTSYVEDVNVVNSPSGKPVLSLLIRLASYDPNMPYLTLWFEYLDIVNDESYLPLNEALPLADNDDNLYHKHVPTTYILEEKGRCVYLEPEPQAEADPGNRTPLPNPAERCLSPAWDPSAPELGSSLAVSSPTYWCTDW
ncbi:hypothetical protein IW261DRAFT_1419600 [Armillaria novae-zelandiae]|uniref:Uncharacterized protein n=1 Tax=Armillaria novae-zelandiae TaxID=153914 RepID=A0AA39P8E4_9AGAR|nr:hypothetical protein IW261DRAFT_1419600 [Armillaria novae-zelandiae]